MNRARDFEVRNLRCLQRRQGRWGVQRGAMQCSPLDAVRAGFPRRRNQLRKQSRPLAAELLKRLLLPAVVEMTDPNLQTVHHNFLYSRDYS